MKLFKTTYLVTVLITILASNTFANVIAYWRFDDTGDSDIEQWGPVADSFPLSDSDGWTTWRKAVHDHSGNGNHLTTWEYSYAGFAWSADVPNALIPLTGESNTLSMQNAGDFPASMTWSQQSGPGGTNIEVITPAAFTIEASFKAYLLDSNHTIVGRDGMYVWTQDTGSQSSPQNWAPLYFSVRSNREVAIEFHDVSGYKHNLESAAGLITTGQWYHMAAVSDGSTLSLYLDNELVGQLDMTASGSPDTSLAVGYGSGSNWQAGTWTVGRGLWNGYHTDRWFGYIDEVRICDNALDPSEFLFRTVIYVDDDAEVFQNGSESYPFDTIQEAVNVAHNGDTIIVKQGIYTGPGNWDIDLPSLAFESLTIRSEDPWNSLIVKNTIIDGGDPNDGGEEHRAFVFDSFETRFTQVRGFTIQRCRADIGGAIYCINSSPRIECCTFRDNHATSVGGAIFADGTCAPYIFYCKFLSNSAVTYGGAITCWPNSIPQIYNSIFSGNISSVNGGAIFCWQSDAFIQNCTFYGNHANSQGGGIYCDNSDIVVINSIFWENTNTSGNSENAQLFRFYSSPDVRYCCIQNRSSLPCTECINIAAPLTPDFVDPDGLDDTLGTIDDNLRLVGGSLCIDAGVNSPGAGSFDLDGKVRYAQPNPQNPNIPLVNPRVDIGAYEYVIHNETQNTFHDTLQEAISYAILNDVILVGEGIYYENINMDKNNLTLKSHNVYEPNLTIINGICSFESVIEITKPNVIIRGFKITGGILLVSDHPDENPDHGGAGVYVRLNNVNSGTSSDFAVTIENSIITENHIHDVNEYEIKNLNGGGIALEFSKGILIKNCAISKNTTGRGSDLISGNGGDGAGIYINDCEDIAILNCNIFSNATGDGGGQSGNGGNGAGIYFKKYYNPDPSSYYSATDFSRYSMLGPWLDLSRPFIGELLINNCTFQNNIAGNGSGNDFVCGQGGDGGAFYYTNNLFDELDSTWDRLEPLLIYSCKFSNNNTGTVVGSTLGKEGEGEGLFIDNGQFYIHDCDIEDLSGSIYRENTICGNSKIARKSEINDPYYNMNVHGLLLAQDNTEIEYAQIIISAESNGVSHGKFFIEDNVYVHDLWICSYGDYYLETNPADPNWNVKVENLTIDVTIQEGVGQRTGGLLEARAFDPNSHLEPDIIEMQAPIFDMNSWTLDSLELLEGAKVNLTNRINYQHPSEGTDPNEAIYIETLVLGDNSQINLAFNRLYYGTVLDRNGYPLSEDYSDPNYVVCFSDGSKIVSKVVNMPLMGFSLYNITCDDDTEFLCRVRDNNEESPDPGIEKLIERSTENSHDTKGTMKMKNVDGIHARAKGLFDKVVEDPVLVMFEYYFENPDSNTALIVYLTNTPKLLSPGDPKRVNHYLQVAKISYRPELYDRPGFPDSDQFSLFKEYVYNTNNLDFTKGLYIELELVGPAGTTLWINDFDPLVVCSTFCGSVNNDDKQDVFDFLTVIGECGHPTSATLNSDGEYDYRDCLEGHFNDNGYVNTADILEWDLSNSEKLCGKAALIKGDSTGTSSTASSYNLCPCSFTSAHSFDDYMLDNNITSSNPNSEPNGLPYINDILVLGKIDSTSDALQRYRDCLYAYNAEGCFMAAIDPNRMRESDRMNYRLVKDPAKKELYILNLKDGMIRLRDNYCLFKNYDDQKCFPYSSDSLKQADVYLGIKKKLIKTQNEEYIECYGRPVLDAAFDSSGYLYVTPVVVKPVNEAEHPYLAAAKFSMSTEDPPGIQDVEALYWYNGILSSRPSEIEVDEAGNVYILNAYHSEDPNNQTYTTDDWLIKYHPDRTVIPVNLSSETIAAPTALYVSQNPNGYIYFASGDYYDSKLYYYSKNIPQAISHIPLFGINHISGITGNHKSGEEEIIYVLGFKMDYFDDVIDSDPASWKKINPVPKLIMVKENLASNLIELQYDLTLPLSLPVSILWTGDIVTSSSNEYYCRKANLNLDNVINLRDYAILAEEWLTGTTSSPPPCLKQDLNGDNKVNKNDMEYIWDCWLEKVTN